MIKKIEKEYVWPVNQETLVKDTIEDILDKLIPIFTITKNR
ncbi:hypothetical protein [Wolbachia endosymbiont of Litomosoides sigmodontis]|nr:hypothetical protein [Wolbachia endosymbiont of Litomosoides sigmodontis]